MKPGEEQAPREGFWGKVRSELISVDLPMSLGIITEVLSHRRTEIGQNDKDRVAAFDKVVEHLARFADPGAKFPPDRWSTGTGKWGGSGAGKTGPPPPTTPSRFAGGGPPGGISFTAPDAYGAAEYSGYSGTSNAVLAGTATYPGDAFAAGYSAYEQGTGGGYSNSLPPGGYYGAGEQSWVGAGTGWLRDSLALGILTDVR